MISARTGTDSSEKPAKKKAEENELVYALKMHPRNGIPLAPVTSENIREDRHQV